MNTPHDSDDNAIRDADERLTESLLRAALRPDPSAQERRVLRVFDALNSEVSDAAETPPLTSKTATNAAGGRRWAVWAAAAVVLLAVGLIWQSNSPSRQAHATVRRGLQTAEEPGPRKYRFHAVVRRPLIGLREVDGELYVDGAKNFALRHPAILPNREFWIGGNEREYWIVPPIGLALVGDRKLLEKWLSDQGELTTPYLHVATMLRRMSQDYDLRMLPDESIPESTDNDRQVACRRVRGVLRDAGKLIHPRVIDLWTDRSTGVARRVVLDWQLPAEEFGRSTVTLELAGPAKLPADWFEHTTHRPKP